MARMPAPLLPVIVAHVVLAVVWGVAMRGELKPLKFAVSIALFLATVGYVLAVVELDARARSLIAWTLSVTMVIEMAAIVMQALRGVGSHFNTKTPFDAAIWNTMMLAIVIATIALIALAWFATTRTLHCGPIVAFQLRVGLWLVMLVVISGFAMGGRGQHGIGGADGGAGLPLAGWSRDHGDLRVAHFFALHGLQALPLAGVILEGLALGNLARWVVAGACALGWVAVSIATLLQAFAGASVLALARGVSFA